MTLFWIAYDLMKVGQDYTRLTNELLRLGARKWMLSDWILHRTDTAAQLRDHLKQFIDKNDRLSVAAISDWATYNAITTPKVLTSKN
jgi:hypothetical protein